ncbi:APC family permease [Anaeromyxobacter oryzae]|uniref:Amino acid permease n=1 Tax=Anaeromyxobacter oryzae TaxID=2918170 RepID=A0ABM7WUJ4_9BACT|nr:APC family permease [Anaeromyxobacter oryzae]BDG03170.1 amino acid permease [Anaeromyxobacter oryzae]
MRVRDALLGKPIPDSEAESESLGPAEAVPVLGLDALASAAYGPEAALAVLVALGAAGVRFIVPITAAIVVLLLLVQTSYRHTISAYPDGGGSYTVAKENLGRGASLLAAASLSVDYVLNVAVAISAGVGALVSAMPVLHRHTLGLCLALLVLLTFANLRGLRTTGAAFMVPTYAFVACLGVAIAVGVARLVAAGGHPAPVVAPSALRPAVEAAGAWVILRAFASGCTAMTGVEAVSNAVPVFREPAQRNAERTLSIIIGILVFLLAGIAILARAYGIGATDPERPGYQSVLSQVVAAVFGRGVVYDVSIASIMTVLCLSANTSFADFPRLCRSLALDGYLPEAFAHAGRRLVYSTGILFLSATAAALLVVFRGVTERLVPLFAVGAFAAFTLSQAGMVRHWHRRRRDRGARRALWINGAGAVATAVTLVVVLASKLLEGAWITVLVIPALILVFRRTSARYEEAARACDADAALDVTDLAPPIAVVPVKRLDALTFKALRFALGISPRVHAVQVLAAGHAHEDLSTRWADAVERPCRAAGLPPPELAVLRSRYRQVVDPLLGYVHRLAAEDRSRFIAVLVPELVEARWYHYLLFSHTATLLKMMLLFRGGPQVVVVNAPWYLDAPRRRRARRGRRGVVPLAAHTAER